MTRYSPGNTLITPTLYATVAEETIPDGIEPAVAVLANASPRAVRKGLEHDGDWLDAHQHTIALADRILGIEGLRPESEAEQSAKRAVASTELSDAAPGLTQAAELRAARSRLGERGATWRGTWPGLIMAGLGATATAGMLSMHGPVTITTPETVPVTLHTTVNHSERAGNPYSPDFHLTGAEQVDDMTALRAMLGTATGSTLKVTEVTITSEASDDADSANAGLGHPDTGNAKIAKLRGEAGDEALVTVARDRQISLTGQRLWRKVVNMY